MLIPIVVDSRLRISTRDLPPGVVEQLRAAFEHPNPKRASLIAMGYSVWNEPERIATWRTETDDRSSVMTFPRGGLSRVRKVLTGAGIDWEILDQRTEGAVLADELPDVTGLELRPYQVTMGDVAIGRENCLLRGATGSGKTIAVIGLAARLKLPTLIVVWAGELYEQWIDQVVEVLGIPKRKVGRIRSGKCDLRPITIATAQSMNKLSPEDMARVQKFFGLVVADEVQRFAARTLFSVIDPLPARYRVGVSADETRRDRREFLVHDLFGDEVAYEVTRDEMIQAGVILEVEVRVIPTDFEAPWYGIPTDQDEDKTPDFDRLLREMAADEERDALVVQTAVTEARAGERVIVMSHRREHCYEIDRKISARAVRSGLFLGGQEFDTARAKTKASLRAGLISCAVGTIQIIGTGIDIPQASVSVIATPIASNKQLVGQVWGRTCRTARGKSTARFYYLWDRHVYPQHLRNLIAWCPRVVVFDRGTGEWVEGKAYQRLLPRHKKGFVGGMR